MNYVIYSIPEIYEHTHLTPHSLPVSHVWHIYAIILPFQRTKKKQFDRIIAGIIILLLDDTKILEKNKNVCKNKGKLLIYGRILKDINHFIWVYGTVDI